MAPTQLRGPNIQISLFGDAAKAGAEVGKEIPSDFTSIYNGVTKGIQTGQEIYGNYQNEQIRQHQIDRQPQADQQQDQQIEQADQLNKQRALQLENQQINQQLTERNTTDKLESENSKFEAAKQLSDAHIAFQDEMKSSDPAQQAQLVLGGKYSGLFGADSKLYQTSLQQVKDNQNNGLTPEVRDQIGVALQKGKVGQAYDAKAAQVKQDGFDAAQAKMSGEWYVIDAARQLNIPAAEASTKLELVPHNQFLTTNGSLAKNRQAGGGWLPNPDYNAAESTGKFDVINHETGTVLNGTGSVTAKQYQERLEFIGKKRLVDGTDKTLAIQQIDKANNARLNPPQSNTVQPTKTQGSFLQNSNPFVSKVATDLNLGENEFKAVEPNLKQLSFKEGQYLDKPLERANVQNTIERNRTINAISRGITDTQFEESPALQKQFTQSDVDRYNAGLDADLKRSRATTSGDPFSAFLVQTDTTTVADALKASSPSDLYYLRQRTGIQKQINDSISKIRADIQSSRDSAINTHKVSQATTSLLSGVIQSGR